MAFVTERGRLPVKDELPEAEALSAEFGNLRRAFQIVLQATNPQEWDEITEHRRQICWFILRFPTSAVVPSRKI